MPRRSRSLGVETAPRRFRPWPSVIGRVEVSENGGVIVRVGRTNAIVRSRGFEEQVGWHETEDVVLTQAEAHELIARLQGALGGDTNG